MPSRRSVQMAAAFAAVFTWIFPASYLSAARPQDFVSSDSAAGDSPSNRVGLKTNRFPLESSPQAPPSAVAPSATARVTATPVARDVSLAPGGAFYGQVVNEQGTPMTGRFVLLQHGGRLVKHTQSDDQGRFAFNGIRGGTYLVSTTNAATTVRLWAPNTAPPAASDGVLLTEGENILLGQNPSRRLLKLALLAAAIGAAIAIPIALANRKEERKQGS